MNKAVAEHVDRHLGDRRARGEWHQQCNQEPARSPEKPHILSFFQHRPQQRPRGVASRKTNSPRLVQTVMATCQYRQIRKFYGPEKPRWLDLRVFSPMKLIEGASLQRYYPLHPRAEE